MSALDCRVSVRCPLYLSLSFPKIISGRIGDAAQPRLEWRLWRQLVGRLVARRSMDWFESLAGFRETRYDETRAALKVKSNQLQSLVGKIIPSPANVLAHHCSIARGRLVHAFGRHCPRRAARQPREIRGGKLRPSGLSRRARMSAFSSIMGNATVIESSPYGPAHPLPSWTPAPASVRPQQTAMG